MNNGWMDKCVWKRERKKKIKFFCGINVAYKRTQFLVILECLEVWRASLVLLEHISNVFVFLSFSPIPNFVFVLIFTYISRLTSNSVDIDTHFFLLLMATFVLCTYSIPTRKFVYRFFKISQLIGSFEIFGQSSTMINIGLCLE